MTTKRKLTKRETLFERILIDHGLTKADVCEEIGCSRTALYNALQQPNPRPSTIHWLGEWMRAMGVKVTNAELMG